MYYVLNKILRFTPRTNELTIVNDYYNNILLSHASTRLLTELIKNSNKISSRDELLKKVWEDYGFSPSNNNLYISLSEIRKAIINLGLQPDFIITVPKVGIKIEAEIDIFEIFKYEHESNENNKIENTYISPKVNNQINDNPLIKETPLRNKINSIPLGIKYLLLLFINLAFLMFFIFQLTSNNNRLIFGEISNYILFDHKNCHIYLLNNDVTGNRELAKKYALTDIIRNGIDCTSDYKNIYYQRGVGSSNDTKNITIGICSVESKNNTCQNIKSL